VELRVLGGVLLNGAVLRTAGAAGADGGNGADGSADATGGQNGGIGRSGRDGTDGTWGRAGGSGGVGVPIGSGGGGSDGSDGENNGGIGGGGGGAGGGGGGGGAGGKGGDGGKGGAGGKGGKGGGGAGGTIRLVCSVVEGSGEVSAPVGGVGNGTYDKGHDGRFVLGRNTTDAFGGTVEDAQYLRITNTAGAHSGTRATNVFVAGGTTETPYIPGLVDGAEIYGLTSLAATDPELAAAVAGAPPNARAGLLLMDSGPASLGRNWDGYDMLLVLNLTGTPIDAPRLGVGQEGHLEPLKIGGWTRDPRFGGGGHAELPRLAAHAVYATLVPAGTTDFNLAATNSPTLHAQSLAAGQTAYLLSRELSITDIAIDGGLLRLSVNNPDPAQSGRVQRAFDLLDSNGWEDIGWYSSGTGTTSWSEAVSQEWERVFYRLRRP